VYCCESLMETFGQSMAGHLWSEPSFNNLLLSFPTFCSCINCFPLKMQIHPWTHLVSFSINPTNDNTMRATQTLARQLARTASSSRLATTSRNSAVLACPACCSPSTARFDFGSTSYAVQAQASQLQYNQQVRFASKKKNSKASHKKSSQKVSPEEDDDEIEVEDHPVPVIAKGKKARAAQMTPEDDVEAFNLDKLEKQMDESIERCQIDMRAVIGRVERLSPGTLSVRQHVWILNLD
jgi:hypothetical protein